MKVAAVGGGPGGLYCSLLLKKADPSIEITIFEKNPRGATYGWGVVFSDRTLTSFREADYKTFKQINDDLVVWDAIDVHYRDELVRAGGQVFSGIARVKLLEILTRRCEEVGVEVVFEREVMPAELRAYDLVIAADGIHSLLRAEYAEAFRPRITLGRSKYIWFGTTRSFDSFTFVFQPADPGLFQVHAYPFDGTRSTFIVECTEEAWAAAGLDGATEAESIAFCEKLFAGVLRGHPLMSNQSSWISFPTLVNASWRSGHVVLLGDAAHTAHFSIGSGTKLAMEDAIALANAVETHGDIDSAVADYEAERKPVVDRFQEAARQSQGYFESTHRYLHLEPEQFVFHLLTRSGRIDYTNLRGRDPHLVERVDRWFAARSEPRPAPPLVAPPPALTPGRLGSLDVANRVALAPVSTYDAVNGVPGDDYLAPLLAAAGSGVGLVMTDEVAVSAHGRITTGCAGLYDDGAAGRFALVCERAHAASARVALRLNHSGRRGACEPRTRGCDRPLRAGEWPLLAPSPLAYGRNTVPHDLLERIDDVLEDYSDAARRAADAGVDALVLEMGRGYLLGSFISPLTNLRTDRYGCSLEGRLRFPLEVFEVVRAAWGERPLGASVCAHDWARGGAGLSEAAAVTEALGERGCDFVEVSAGGTVPFDRPRYEPYYLISYSDRIRNETGIPTIVGGDIATLDRVSTVVAGGRADVCILRSV